MLLTVADHTHAPERGTAPDTLGARQLLQQLEQEVRGCVPSALGISLGASEDGLLQTVAASAPEVAVLDALQYVDGGPGVMSACYGTRIEARLADRDGGSWGLLASGRDTGVGAVLSLPVTDSGRTLGALTVYAAEADAFDGHLAALTEICRRRGAHAVRAASVSDSERLSTALAPERARDQNAIDRAIALLGRHLGTDSAASADHLRRAATRAGLTDSALAYAVIDLLEE